MVIVQWYGDRREETVKRGSLHTSNLSPPGNKRRRYLRILLYHLETVACFAATSHVYRHQIIRVQCFFCHYHYIIARKYYNTDFSLNGIFAKWICHYARFMVKYEFYWSIA